MSSLLYAQTARLHIAYEQHGPADGTPVVFLHGFPYGIRQFDRVVAELADAGVRAIVPWLRGFGATRYANAEVLRTGQQAAVAQDVIDLLDALAIDRALLVGYDWGGRAACICGALWPERVLGIVTTGYHIQNIPQSVTTPASPEAERHLWYQWYFQTERGERGLEQNRAAIAHLLWQLWSPTWQFSNAYFEETAEAFANPDFVRTAIHSYRHRYANVPGDPELQPIEDALAQTPPIVVPAITVHGSVDPLEPAVSSATEARHFKAHYELRIVPGIGHCPPAEAPEAVAQAVRDLLAIVMR